MKVPRNIFLTGVAATLGGCNWWGSPKCAYKPPPRTSDGHVADAFLPVNKKVDIGLKFARAVVQKKELRQLMDAKAKEFRELPCEECDRKAPDPFGTFKPLWQTYARWITEASHYHADPANGAPELGRGDVVDILWVASNFFLGAAARLGGFRHNEPGLEWPPETKKKDDVCIMRAHMVPLMEAGASNVTAANVPFDVQDIAGDKKAYVKPIATRQTQPAHCPPPLVVTPPPPTLKRVERVNAGHDVATAFIFQHAVREDIVSVAVDWRQNDPTSECSPHGDGHPMWMHYREEIHKVVPALKEIARATGGINRTDVVDILWVTQNFFLSCAGVVSGYAGETIHWPPESAGAAASWQAARSKTGNPMCKVHMVPVPPIGGTEITQCDVDFRLPHGTSDPGSCPRPPED